MAEVNCHAPETSRVTPTNLTESTTITKSMRIIEFNSKADVQRNRARERWDFVKKAATSRGYKLGEGVSMSTAEAKFLNMMTKNILDFDHAKYTEDHIIPMSPKSEDKWRRDNGVDDVLRKVAEEVPQIEMQKIEGQRQARRGTQVFHVVKAAVAKERLRKSIAKRLSDLSGPEVKYLTVLVNSEDVTPEQLTNALDVLDNDPMYNCSLQEEDDEFDIAVHGEKDSEARRRSTLNEQFKMFDNSVSTRKLDCSDKDLDASRCNRRSGRRSSVIEACVWKEIDDAMLNRSTHSHQFLRDEPIGSDGNKEKKHIGKSAEHQKPSSTKSAFHIKRLSSKAGHAIDPLLSATPMEIPETRQEDINLPCCPTEPEKKRSYGEELGSMLLQPFICCGMNEVNLNDEDKEVNVADEEFGSLESKKRYLHLDVAGAAKEHREKLSTWLGAPEDYPILGLEKVDEIGNDPLDPHVVSPLLMKCLRDHLPYALREENFWLKYSLVRDGASLDVIFKNLRHSQHTVLAIETTQGEVFGSFTGNAWRNNGNNYYGSCNAFVWNLRKRRDEDNCSSLDEYILRESSLDIYPWASKGGNRNVQLSNTRKLFIGGGEPDEVVLENVEIHRDEEKNQSDEPCDDAIQWGMALALDKDLLFGTSSRCATFGSNPLIGGPDADSEVFEIVNMEIWSLTPCMTEELAENLELGRTFVMGLHNN